MVMVHGQNRLEGGLKSVVPDSVCWRQEVKTQLAAGDYTWEGGFGWLAVVARRGGEMLQLLVEERVSTASYGKGAQLREKGRGKRDFMQ